MTQNIKAPTSAYNFFYLYKRHVNFFGEFPHRPMGVFVRGGVDVGLVSGHQTAVKLNSVAIENCSMLFRVVFFSLQSFFCSFSEKKKVTRLCYGLIIFEVFVQKYAVKYKNTSPQAHESSAT